MAAVGSLAWQLKTADPGVTEHRQLAAGGRRVELGSTLTRDSVELAYDSIAAWREELEPLLGLPYFRELRRGLDVTLARLYRELVDRRAAHV